MSPLQEFIVLLVEEKGPIRNVDLGVEVASHKHGIDPKEITDAVDELVASGEIVEVEYILERMNYRIKSMYFPRGTEVRLREPVVMP